MKEFSQRYNTKLIADDYGKRANFFFKTEEEEFCIEELLAVLFKQIKKIAEAYLGANIKTAVISVPSCFSDSQRQAIKDSGTIAGLDVIRLTNESTAVAVGYGCDKLFKKERKLLVFDIGAGKLEVSIVTIEDWLYENNYNNGRLDIGGEDFDFRLVDYCAIKFKDQTGVDFRCDFTAFCKVKSACEKAKKALSFKQSVIIEEKSLFQGYDLSLVITREIFEEINEDLFESCINMVRKVLKDSKIRIEEIEEILLVGGSSRIPKIIKLIEENFPKSNLNNSLNPLTAVTFGAAIYAAKLFQNKALPEFLQNLLIIDCIPHNIILKINNEANSIISKGPKTVPFKQTDFLTTQEDYQTSLAFSLYQELNEKIQFIGDYVLEGIYPQKKELSKIILTIHVDENGILFVNVSHFNSKLWKIIVKSHKMSLNKEQINQLRLKHIQVLNN